MVKLNKVPSSEIDGNNNRQMPFAGIRPLPTDELDKDDIVAFFSIGLLLCEKMNKGFVEFAVRDKSKPLGIATYQTLKSIPKPYQTLAPVIEGVKRVHSASQKVPVSASVLLKTIYDSDGTSIHAAHINGYLMDAPDAYIDCPEPVCEGVDKMTKGSQPTDGGNLSDWSEERRQDVVSRYPAAASMFRRITGSDEYINNITRWCLWLKDVSPAAIRAVPPVMEAVERTRQMRLESKKPSTRNWAKKPTLFTKGCQPESGHYIIVPSVSSEKREYIPIGFLGSEVIVNNLALFIPNATLYDFGVLMSRVHMAWVRTTAGRLEMRYRYSAKLCYNSFIWPDLCDSVSLREKISEAAQAVLDARAAHPDATLADLYDPLTMPPDLVKAHAHLDALVDKAYGLSPSCTDSDRVALLFRLYAEQTERSRQAASCNGIRGRNGSVAGI